MVQAKDSPNDSIRCPKCGEVIPITATLRQQLAEEARIEMRREFAQHERDLSSKEAELRTQQQELQRAREEIEERVKECVDSERKKLNEDALTRARAEVSVELRDLESEVTKSARALQLAQENELELRKAKRELEEAKRILELDVARQIDAERERIRDTAIREATEEHQLKDAEKDYKLREVMKANDELRRKLQQGSQQVQGEVSELELEHLLHDSCPFDEVVPVPKGVRGADVLQKVHSRSGHCCGKILWEAKHTKKWNEAWISKLKEDQQAAHADLAVLVTDVMPTEISPLGERDGVWITSRRNVPGLVVALRQTLVEIAQVKRATTSKDATVEALFGYLTGPEFRQRVEAIVRAFIGMRDELEDEKRATVRRWAKREKQLELVSLNTSGMYGDLQGLIGTSLKPIAALEPVDSGLEDETADITLAARSDDGF